MTQTGPRASAGGATYPPARLRPDGNRARGRQRRTRTQDFDTAIARWEPTATAIVHQDWETPLPQLRPNRPATAGGYALPVDRTWWNEHPDWFTLPHHDYPALDLPVPENTPVYAITNGTATTSQDPRYGNGITITEPAGRPAGRRWTYCHLNTLAITNGARVTAGQRIGTSGNTGNTTGPHLHLQATQPDGNLACPQAALTAWANGQTLNPDTLPVTGCTT